MPRKKKAPIPTHYEVLFLEENPDVATVRKFQGGQESETTYNSADLGGFGACSCEHFFNRVYSKRRKLITESLKKNGGMVTYALRKEILLESGTCIHEKIINIIQEMLHVVRTELERAFGERRWRENSIILIGEVLRKMHASVGIQSYSPQEPEWVSTAMGYFLEGLRNSAPKLDGEKFNPPDWIWTNKKILQRAGDNASEILIEKLAQNQKMFSNSLGTMMAFMTTKHQAVEVTGIATSNAQVIDEYCEEHSWLPESFRACLRYVADNQEPDPPESVKLEFLERETLKRHGGKPAKFVEIFAI